MKISALGIFHVSVNGKEIEEYFMPGWTNYHQYVRLCTYDITEQIQTKNLLEITLSEGWYAGRLGYTKQSKVYGDTPKLYAEILIDYADGSTESFCTDESWRVAESHIAQSSLLDGETVDFRTPKLPYESLPFAKECKHNVEFEDYSYEPVKKFASLKPTVLYEDEKVLRLDFGQNFAGFLNFEVEGEAGTELQILHAEMLSECGSLYLENLRSAEAIDRLILSGGKDFFDPKFTFHGFRYAEIRWTKKVKITNVQGIAITQALQYDGKFTCSNEIVNAIFRNVQWGQKSNFISLPTDCPQRDERIGWAGDTQVFCNTAMFNCNCNAFLSSYMKLIRTDMQPDDRVPSLVPFFVPLGPSTAGVPGWADAICVIPYYHYLHYRDKRIIEENLSCAVRHVEYYMRNSEDGILKVANPFGDWLAVEQAADIEVISQCFFGLSSLLLSKMFGIVGDAQNSEKYFEVYENAKTAFRKHYLKRNGVITGDSQTAYAFAFSVGFVSADEIKIAFLKCIRRSNNRLTTGFVGVKYLLPALCEIGETDLAYQILQETEYPSWGYTIQHGATTIWERWNGYTEENGFETPTMNSFNHYCLGSCVEWLYSHVLGIKLSLDGGICLSPSLSNRLTYAKGEYRSVQGLISVEWHYVNGEYHYHAQAEEGVELSYDFGDMEIRSIETSGNVLHAILK
jgi:alpha-L-rhamnosidase